MSKQWVEADAEIGKLIEQHGVANYAQFQPIRKCVLYMGSLDHAFSMQMAHKRWLERAGITPKEVIEIGAGVGILANIFAKESKVSIIDNPNISKVQAYNVPHIPHVDATYEVKDVDNTLIVSLFAMSEIDYAERDVYWNRFKDCQWFWGFQEHHEGFNNLDWFVKKAISARRKFIMDTVPGFKGLWYLYMEARK